MSSMQVNIVRTQFFPDMVDDESDPASICELAEEFDIDISAISPYRSPGDMNMARLGRIYRNDWPSEY